MAPTREKEHRRQQVSITLVLRIRWGAWPPAWKHSGSANVSDAPKQAEKKGTIVFREAARVDQPAVMDAIIQFQLTPLIEACAEDAEKPKYFVSNGDRSASPQPQKQSGNEQK